MATKVYKSAMGRVVDMGTLMLENEHTRAVGNMNVNSRGDLLDANNRSIQSRNQQVGDQYKKQASSLMDTPVTSSSAVKKPTAPVTPPPPPPEDFDDNFNAEDNSGEGLAAAIRRARDNNK